MAVRSPLRRYSFEGVLAPLLLLILVGCGIWGGTSEDTSSGYQGTELRGTAGGFSLTDQNGATIALSALRGKVVVLAFLDPVCTDVCPLTAHEFHLTAQKLGERAAEAVFLAVNVNPQVNSVEDVADATERWGVGELANWHYITGAADALEPVYWAYNILAHGPPKPGKPNELEHTPGVYVIDKAGQRRWYISTAFDPGVSLSGLLLKHVGALLKE